jgi:S-adenosyl methyltransferase
VLRHSRLGAPAGFAIMLCMDAPDVSGQRRGYRAGGRQLVDDVREKDRLTARGLDITVPNVARIYDYILGGKYNISQVVSRCPHSGRAASIQACHDTFSNIGAIAARRPCCTSMGVMSDFLGGRS